jgi:hypothetical protein
MKISNNIGPKVELCGTPDNMGEGEEDLPKCEQEKIWAINNSGTN